VSGRVAIIAALPREVAGLVRGWDAQGEQHERGVFAWTSAEAVVVAAGMGERRAALAVEAALAAGCIEQLVSVGLAGGCDPGLLVGSVMEAAEVIDVRSGERFATSAAAGVTLATGNAIATVREKARLFAVYGAAAVDMEAATVARLAQENGLAFRAIKGVSDDYSFELGSLGRFTTKHGHFHTRAFALHTAVRPHTWRQTIRLGRHSKQALKALHAVLRSEFHLH
jgi:adenosylhomocysteine nucleosidase